MPGARSGAYTSYWFLFVDTMMNVNIQSGTSGCLPFCSSIVTYKYFSHTYSTFQRTCLSIDSELIQQSIRVCSAHSRPPLRIRIVHQEMRYPRRSPNQIESCLMTLLSSSKNAHKPSLTKNLTMYIELTKTSIRRHGLFPGGQGKIFSPHAIG